MKPYLAAVLACFLMCASCVPDDTAEKKATQDGEETTQTAAPAVAVQAASPTRIWKGYYIFGHESNTFRPCGSDTVYWVVGDRRTVERLKMRYAQAATDPYEEVYVELKGKIIYAPPDEGMAAGYPAQLSLGEVLVVKKKSDTDCGGKTK